MTWLYSTGQIEGRGTAYIERRASVGGSFVALNLNLAGFTGWVSLPAESPWYRDADLVRQSLIRRGELLRLRRQEVEVVLAEGPIGYYLDGEFDATLGVPLYCGGYVRRQSENPQLHPYMAFHLDLGRISQKYGIRKSVVATVLSLRYEMPPVAYLHKHPEGINSWFLTPDSMDVPVYF